MNKRIAAACVSIFVSLCFVEFLLRLMYPDYLRVYGDRIVLPRNTTNVTQYHQPPIAGHVTVTKNSLGYRGPEPPVNVKDYISILTVGGSTTEQLLVTDGSTWTDVLASSISAVFSDVWVNNAGLDGHSTYGHLALLSQHIAALKPDVIIYLVGLNDFSLDRATGADVGFAGNRPVTWLQEAVLMAARRSYIVAFLLEYYRNSLAMKHMLIRQGHVIDFTAVDQMQPDHEAITDSINGFRKHPYVSAYKQRLRALVAKTREAGALPVLVTQPVVYGVGRDDVTGMDLESMVVADTDEFGKQAGAEVRGLLEVYNDATRAIASASGVPLVDLAARMPTSTSQYYDFVHFTASGSATVAHIIFDKLCPLLIERYPKHVMDSCPQ